MNYEEKILEICEQYKASDLYSKIPRDMQTLMNTCSKKEEMMDRSDDLLPSGYINANNKEN